MRRSSYSRWACVLTKDNQFLLKQEHGAELLTEPSVVGAGEPGRNKLLQLLSWPQRVGRRHQSRGTLCDSRGDVGRGSKPGSKVGVGLNWFLDVKRGKDCMFSKYLRFPIAEADSALSTLSANCDKSRQLDLGGEQTLSDWLKKKKRVETEFQTAGKDPRGIGMWSPPWPLTHSNL